MANCLFGFPNLIDDSTLSGGSYMSGAPRSLLLTRKLREVARTADLVLASNILNIDLGSTKGVKLFSAVNHNFSIDAKYRLRGSNDSSFATSLYDSSWVDVWPVVYPFGSVPWEHPSWFGGKYAPEEIAGYTASLVVVLSLATMARYWRLELDDADNVDGFLQWGRVFIGPAWQPVSGTSWGLSLGWETKTASQESRGGAEYFDRRIPYRVCKYKLDFLTRDDAMANAFEIQRRAGIDKEILWVENPDDTVHALRTQYLGRLRVLNAIEYPYFDNNTVAFEMKELL